MIINEHSARTTRTHSFASSRIRPCRFRRHRQFGWRKKAKIRNCQHSISARTPLTWRARCGANALGSPNVVHARAPLTWLWAYLFSSTRRTSPCSPCAASRRRCSFSWPRAQSLNERFSRTCNEADKPPLLKRSLIFRRMGAVIPR